jgi:hypothetical protein
MDPGDLIKCIPLLRLRFLTSGPYALIASFKAKPGMDSFICQIILIGADPVWLTYSASPRQV